MGHGCPAQQTAIPPQQHRTATTQQPTAQHRVNASLTEIDLEARYLSVRMYSYRRPFKRTREPDRSHDYHLTTSRCYSAQNHPDGILAVVS
jgi:hypothetical protein